MNTRTLGDFIEESNAIEGINRTPTKQEMAAAEKFINLRDVTISDLEAFVSACAPGHVLRRKPHHNVTVGNHMPPPGGISIAYKLQEILNDMDNDESPAGAYKTHVAYELLHPFTDGNGRSGRILWIWQMNRWLGKLPSLSFLRSFYYSALGDARE